MRDWRRETRWAYYDKQTFPDLSAGARTGDAESVELMDEGLMDWQS